MWPHLPAEALSKLDEGRYSLVLSDTRVPRNVLAYARVKDYHPATAQVTSYEPSRKGRPAPGRHNLSIYTENLPNLLGEVAELIGVRASPPLSSAAHRESSPRSISGLLNQSPKTLTACPLSGTGRNCFERRRLRLLVSAAAAGRP